MREISQQRGESGGLCQSVITSNNTERSTIFSNLTHTVGRVGSIPFLTELEL